MTYSASESLQRGLFSLMSADAPLMAMLTGIHDQVPAGSAFPYAVFEQCLETDDSTNSRRTSEVQLTLALYSRAAGRQQLLSILALLGEVLETLPVLTDWSLVFLRSPVTSLRPLGGQDGWRAELTLTALLERNT